MVYAPFDADALARELSSGLLGGLHAVTVESVVDVDIPLQIAIRVPVAAWAAVIAEREAVAAMLPDTVLGAHIQIEDDAPKSLPPQPRYDEVVVGGRWSRSKRAELDALLVPRGRTGRGLPVFGLGEPRKPKP